MSFCSTEIICRTNWDPPLEEEVTTCKNYTKIFLNSTYVTMICESDINLYEKGVTSKTAGRIVGICLIGCLSDWLGRKKVFLLTYSINVLFGIINSTTSNIPSLMTFNGFFCGFSELALLLTITILYFELMTKEHGGKVMLLYEWGSILGPFIFVYLSMIYTAWWFFNTFSLAPKILILLLIAKNVSIFKINEPPVWLYVKTGGNLTSDNRKKRTRCTEGKNFWDAKKTLLRIFIPLIVSCTICGLISSSVHVEPHSKRKDNNRLLSNLWILIVHGLGASFSIILSNKIGRRWTHMCAYFCITFSYGVLSLLEHTENWLINYFNDIIILSIDLIRTTISLQCLELYPTVFRQRFSSFTYVFYLIGEHFLGSLLWRQTLIKEWVCLCGSVAVFFLPETKDKELSSSILDCKRQMADQKVFSIN